jgi:hypothetical protein
MSQSYCAVRISEHMARDANGTLICLSAPICRSGYQTYKANEVDPQSGDDSEVDILRPVSEVTSPATIASFEGVDLTLRHPATFVTPDTHSWSALGHAQNVRIGPNDEDGNVQLVADLFIKDRSLQEAIERGVRDLSCGYRYDLVQLSNGDWAQVNIRGNHIAVVENGRAGTSKIMDSKDGDMDGQKLDRLCDLLEKLLPSQSQDAECNCGGKKQHSDACPCYDKEAVDGPIDKAAEGMATGNLSELSEAGEEMTSGAVEKAAGMVGSLMDDDPDGNLDPQYTKSARVNNREGQPEMGNFTPVRSNPNNAKTGATGNVNPVAARDALQSLANPSLRAAVRAGGKKVIDAYNATVRGLRTQLRAGNGGRALGTDGINSSSRRKADAASFEASAAKFHGKAIKLHADVNAADEHRGEDAQQPEESFDEAVERVRREQIERWTPKRRR